MDASTDFSSIVKSEGLFRAFNFSYEHQNWCSTFYNKTNPSGLLYVKNPKASSCTTAGITLRIANRNPRAEESNESRSCIAKVDHVPNYHVGKLYGNRDKSRSFLFTTVRDPATRAISRVFFSSVSQYGNKPTDENILRWMTNSDSQKGIISPGMGGFQLAYLSMSPIQKYSAWSQEKSDSSVRTDDQLNNIVLNSDVVHANVKRIIDQYDFVILVERFDESLVAMQLLLDLSLTDMLYLSSKHAGDYWMNNKGKCVHLHPSHVSPAVAEYLNSQIWFAQNYGDYLLHEAANQSLDLTIERLGFDRFNQAFKQFLEVKDNANDECGVKAVFPCSSSGKPQADLASSHCYQKDWGCGYPCLDFISRNFV